MDYVPIFSISSAQSVFNICISFLKWFSMALQTAMLLSPSIRFMAIPDLPKRKNKTTIIEREFDKSFRVSWTGINNRRAKLA